jgi:hypothetical protein
MLPPLQRRLDRMEHQRSALLEEIGRLRGDQLGFRPGPECWCTLEVVEHLVRVEEAIVLRASQHPPSRTLGQGLRAATFTLLLRLRLRAGARLKAPSRAILPQGTATLPELGTRWDQVREKLQAVLADQTRADLRRPMMRHPLVGWLTPVQTLGFLEYHVAHHARQLARIRRTEGYPGSA